MTGRFLPVAFLFACGLVGGAAGFFVGPLLVMDWSFGFLLGVCTVPAGVWVGLLTGYVIARLLEPEDPPRREERRRECGRDAVEGLYCTADERTRPPRTA